MKMTYKLAINLFKVHFAVAEQW